MKTINFTKFKLFPLVNYSDNGELNMTNKRIKVLKEDVRKEYKYKEMKNKYLFMIIKYIPLLLLLMMVTSYELTNMVTQIILGTTVSGLGLLSNLKYDDKLSFIVATAWYLLFVFISGIENAPFIFKYALISYLISQFIFDLYRKYYEVLEDNIVISFMFIKRDKL
ncbi:MAG: hypothetical protein WBF48_00745 [Halarcobacter sp.]